MYHLINIVSSALMAYGLITAATAHINYIALPIALFGLVIYYGNQEVREARK